MVVWNGDVSDRRERSFFVSYLIILLSPNYRPLEAFYNCDLSKIMIVWDVFKK